MAGSYYSQLGICKGYGDKVLVTGWVCPAVATSHCGLPLKWQKVEVETRVVIYNAVTTG